MKRTISLMLAICLCAVSLFGCTAKQPERTKREILPEVAQALEMDDKDAAEVEKLFEAFDEAFARLSKNATDEDLFNYASAVAKANEKFADLFGKMQSLLIENLESTASDEKKDEYSKMLAQHAGVIGSKVSLNLKLLGSSGEECAEAAFALVNEYSNFFYGEDWITEEKLDSLG